MPAHPKPVVLCPICRGSLTYAPGTSEGQVSLHCQAGHRFDAAKQGYFNFLTGKGTVFKADSAAMVAARHDFLASGHYDALADAVADSVLPVLAGDSPVILDSGTGTGHYLRRVLDRTPPATRIRALAMDISKFALRRAARLNPEALNLVADIWQPLPVADHALDAIMVVFAPRNPAEFARALRPGGLLVVVTPRPGHLSEIVADTGMLEIEQGKDERLAGQMATWFNRLEVKDLDVAMDLPAQSVADLAYMGPAGHHLDRPALAGGLPGDSRTRVTAHFRITTLRPLRD